MSQGYFALKKLPNAVSVIQDVVYNFGGYCRLIGCRNSRFAGSLPRFKKLRQACQFVGGFGGRALRAVLGQGSVLTNALSTKVSRSLKIKNSDRSRFTQRSAQVLFLLERTLLKCWNDNPTVDDQVVSLALMAAIQHKMPDSEVVSYVLSRLTLAAEEASISEADWTMAQRIVLESVTTRSNCEAGSRGYLKYCHNFVAQARRIDM